LTTKRARGAIAGFAVAALLVGAGSAQAATFTFSNPAPINLSSLINGPALLYPSTIHVSGVKNVTDVNATLKGFSAPEPADFDVMLAAPGTQASVLMSDLPDGGPGCRTPVSGLTLTFDDEAPAPIPGVQTLQSGTYQPLDNDNNTTGCGATNTQRPDAYPQPAPDEPTDTPLGVFSGNDPEGDWGLFVLGDLDGNTGSIGGGWTLQLTTSDKFGLGKLKKNKKKGTAKLTVDVPGPGTVSLGGKGVKAQRPRSGERITAAKAVTEAGTVTFPIKAKGKKKSKLKSTGKVKLKVKVTYTPSGGAADTETKPVKLIDN
jgi:hypothetical protein